MVFKSWCQKKFLKPDCLIPAGCQPCFFIIDDEKLNFNNYSPFIIVQLFLQTRKS